MNQKGLSLLEVTIALILLAGVVVGLASIFIAGRRYVLHSRRRMSAAEIGRQFIDPLHMQVRQDQWGANCVSDTTQCADITQDGLTGSYLTSAVAGSNVRKVILNVTWQEQQ